VLKFAGDAIIVAWPLAEGDSGATAARAAAACALALVSLKDAPHVTGALALSLHIGLHAGALSEMIVGDGDMDGGRWEHVCVGEPLAAIAPLVAAAASGEVCASDAVWALLQGAAVAGDAVCAGGRTLLAMADGAAPPLLAATTSGDADDGGAAAALELAAATSYLAPGLVAALAGGGHTFGAATLRRVTVLFILLPPCGADDFSLLSALVREIHTVVGECGGTTQQSLADDKGTVSIGIWGKPGADGVDTFADSSERALAAAKHLGGSLRRIAAAHGRDDPIACGVCKGRAFVGNVGSPSRCEWAVVGVRTSRRASFG
jgi:class 3 adenylate cyclase